jgi:hypothetical protein
MTSWWRAPVVRAQAAGATAADGGYRVGVGTEEQT